MYFPCHQIPFTRISLCPPSPLRAKALFDRWYLFSWVPRHSLRLSHPSHLSHLSPSPFSPPPPLVLPPLPLPPHHGFCTSYSCTKSSMQRVASCSHFICSQFTPFSQLAQYPCLSAQYSPLSQLVCIGHFIWIHPFRSQNAYLFLKETHCHLWAGRE